MGVTQVEEAIEQVIDTVDVAPGRPAVYIAVGLVVGAGAGGSIAWFVAKRRYKLKYEVLAQQEIAEAKAFYNKLAKSELNWNGEEPNEQKLSERGAEAVDALVNYRGDGAAVREVVVSEEVTEVEVRPVTSNVFEQNRAELIWDQDREDEYRATIGEGEPYIICQKEYMENENDYEQKTFTYFAEDDVLVDDKDSPIELIDMVVGEDNLTRFGHGTTDNRIVLIRNDKLRLDFEIVKNDGSYSKDVLGFQHSDGPKVRKMRRDIE
jgi:hypothetical protein